jgi:hypothetical protein
MVHDAPAGIVAFAHKSEQGACTVKAAVVAGFDRPLLIKDVPIPVPGPEQVLVRIETCGLCHMQAARTDRAHDARASAGV